MIKEPLWLPASTTSKPSLIPLIKRLRKGKVCFPAGVKGRNSVTSAPWLRISARSGSFCIKYRVPRPQPSTATVVPPANIAPLWAVLSIPSAPPLTTMAPAPATPLAIMSHTCTA